MSSLITILPVLLLVFCGYTTGKLYTVKDCGKSFVPKGRIVNGKTVHHGDYPWMVSIQEIENGKSSHMCGGSIINENWILTAAHCFDQPIQPQQYEVYAGLYSLLQMNAVTVRKYKVAKIIIHNQYNEDGFANDVALVKTATPIDIKGSKGYINGICLPSGVTTPTGEATVIGWGKLRDNGPIPDKLQEASVPIVPWQKCKEIYGNKDSEFEFIQIVPSMLCAGGKGKDACQNDSGGPLFQIVKGVATLIGTVANGADCAYKHYPGIYMKVSAFKGWMDNVMT